ncbi:DUF7848 domain-containing protein [Streptomyces xiamenensis]
MWFSRRDRRADAAPMSHRMRCDLCRKKSETSVEFGRVQDWPLGRRARLATPRPGVGRHRAGSARSHGHRGDAFCRMAGRPPARGGGRSDLVAGESPASGTGFPDREEPGRRRPARAQWARTALVTAGACARTPSGSPPARRSPPEGGRVRAAR